MVPFTKKMHLHIILCVVLLKPIHPMGPGTKTPDRIHMAIVCREVCCDDLVSGLASWHINFTHPKEWERLSIHSHPKLQSVPGREAPTSPRHRCLWRWLEAGDAWV